MKEGKLYRELELVLSLFPYRSQISQSLLAHFITTKLVYYHAVKKNTNKRGRAVPLTSTLFLVQ